MAWGRKQKTEQGRPRQRVSRLSSSKPSYASYYSSQKPSLEPEKSIDLRQKGRSLRLVPTFLALSVIVGSVLFSLTLSARPGVEVFNNSPSPYRPLEDYALAAEKLMGQSLGNKTKLTINTSVLEQAMLEQFPELDAVALRLPVLGRKPNLVLDIKPPVLLLTTPTKSFVLDDTGSIISEVKSLPEESRKNLRVVQDQSGLSLEVGKQAVTTTTVQFIMDAVAQLEAAKLNISQLILPQSANQLDIRLNGISYFVKTDVAGNARLQLGSFLAVKESLEKQGIKPAEYIDVRVEEKVFYK